MTCSLLHYPQSKLQTHAIHAHGQDRVPVKLEWKLCVLNLDLKEARELECRNMTVYCREYIGGHTSHVGYTSSS